MWQWHLNTSTWCFNLLLLFPPCRPQLPCISLQQNQFKWLLTWASKMNDFTSKLDFASVSALCHKKQQRICAGSTMLLLHCRERGEEKNINCRRNLEQSVQWRLVNHMKSVSFICKCVERHVHRRWRNSFVHVFDHTIQWFKNLKKTGSTLCQKSNWCCILENEFLALNETKTDLKENGHILQPPVKSCSIVFSSFWRTQLLCFHWCDSCVHV